MWSGIFSLFLGQLFGSTVVPIVTKIGLRFSPPLIFVFYRFLFAALLFLPFFLFAKKQKLNFYDYKRFSILSALLFINVTFFTIGIQFTTTLMSQVLYTLSPIVVGILGHIFLRERLTKQKITGLFIALTGVGFLLYQSATKQASLTFGTLLGNSMILAAMSGYSTWILYSRSLANSKRYSSVQITFLTFFFIAIYLLLLLPFQQKLAPSFIQTISFWGIIDALIVASGSIILYFFVQLGIKKTSAFTASLFQYVGPFLTASISIPLLHEKLTFQLVIGGILIIAGVFYATSFSIVKKYLKL